MKFLDFGRFAVALFLAMFSACFLSGIYARPMRSFLTVSC